MVEYFMVAAMVLGWVFVICLAAVGIIAVCYAGFILVRDFALVLSRYRRKE